MSVALPLAQDGPVIPDFGRGDDCIRENGRFCFNWFVDNFDERFLPRVGEHLKMTAIAIAIGFFIAFTAALLAHRHPRFELPFANLSSLFYTIPSIAFFQIMVPITGIGWTSILIALVSYTLLIIFRNVVTGLDNVAPETRDAARGLGLTERQVLWKVELPLALPEIMAGLRVAVTTTVGLATLAFFAGAGGLGGAIFSDLSFKSNVIVAGGLCVLLAFALDLLILGVQRLLTPWRRARVA
jgi:osmoprotectant transport system permease protein